jgi:hypothetical protein
VTARNVTISGAPSPVEAAAVAAAISRMLDEEAGAMATPPRVPRPSAWVLASQTRDVPVAVTPGAYDALAWAEADRVERSADR